MRSNRWAMIGVLFVCFIVLVLFGFRYYSKHRLAVQVTTCFSQLMFLSKEIQLNLQVNPRLLIRDDDTPYHEGGFGFQGEVYACPAGAPGRDHGGWQSMQLTDSEWNPLVESGEDLWIPLVWCGGSHAQGSLYSRSVMLVRAGAIKDMRLGNNVDLAFDFTFRQFSDQALRTLLQEVLTRAGSRKSAEEILDL